MSMMRDKLKPQQENNQIEIVCNEKLQYNLKDQWEYIQNLKKIHKDQLNDDDDHDEDHDHRHDYIDTFLSKQILEVLKDYGNNYKSIIYVKNSSIEIEEKFNEFFSNHENKKINRIQPKLNIIADIDINNLNTFATSEKVLVEYKYGFRRGEQDFINMITFPTKLIFELTPIDGNSFTSNELQNLTESINNEIAKKISIFIQNLVKEISKTKEDIMEISNKKKIEKEKLELSEYLHKKINDFSDESWKDFVNKNNLLIIKKIIDELKKTDDAENVVGGKKSKKLQKKKY